MDQDQYSVRIPPMRVFLKSETIQRIEKIIGRRLTTNCDVDINRALDIISSKNSQEIDRK